MNRTDKYVFERFREAFIDMYVRYNDPQIKKRQAAIEAATSLFRDLEKEIARLREIEAMYEGLCK